MEGEFMKVEVGKNYEIIRHGRFDSNLEILVEKVNENSVIASIVKPLERAKERTIINKKYFIKQVEPTKEKRTMKFNESSASLLIPSSFGFKKINQITISKNGLSICTSIMNQLGNPDYIKLYFDKKEKLFFIFKCGKDDKGARIGNLKGKNDKIGYRRTFSGAIMTALIKELTLDINNYRYYADPEEIEGRTDGLGFNLNKLSKVSKKS